jgi:hypothetical protein
LPQTEVCCGECAEDDDGRGESSIAIGVTVVTVELKTNLRQADVDLGNG